MNCFQSRAGSTPRSDESRILRPRRATPETHGGWLPLVTGAAIMMLMLIWIWGRKRLYQRIMAAALPARHLLDELAKGKILRVPGTAVFMSGKVTKVPTALLHNLKHNHVLHNRSSCCMWPLPTNPMQLLRLPAETRTIQRIRNQTRRHPHPLTRPTARIAFAGWHAHSARQTGLSASISRNTRYVPPDPS